MSTHNTFLWRNDKNYPSVIIKYPPYLFYRMRDSQDLLESGHVGFVWDLPFLPHLMIFLTGGE